MAYIETLENLSQDLSRRLALAEGDLIQSADSLLFIGEEIGRVLPADCTSAELSLLDSVTRDFRAVSQKTAQVVFTHAQLLMKAHVAFSVDTIDQARAGIGLAQHYLTLADKLGGADGYTSEQRNQLEVWLTTAQDRLRSSERFITVRDAIAELQKRASGFQNVDSTRAVDLYNEARTKAENAIKDAGWNVEELDALHKIQAVARTRYDDIRKRLEIPTTLIVGQSAEAVRLFARLDKAQQKEENNSERIVYYFSGPGPIDVPKSMDVEEALSVARIKLVNYWDERVQEYIRQSREFLATHKPKDAQISLDQWQQLPGLNDELVDVPFPDNLRIRIREIQAQIDPELKQMKAAEERIERALLKLDKPIDALQDWVAAQEAYPFLPTLADANERINRAAHEKLTGGPGGPGWLERIDANLQRENTWWQAASPLDAVAALLAQFDGLKLQYEGHYVRLKAMFDLIAQLKPAGAGGRRLSNAEERNVLRKLRADLEPDEESYWHQPGWQNVRMRLSTLESESIVQDTLQQVKAVCNIDSAKSEMEIALRAVEQLQQDPPEHSTPKQREDMAQGRKQLLAWMGYADARDQIRLYDEDQPADLSIVRAGLEAAQQAEGLPRTKRQELQRRLDDLERDDSDARKALQEVQALRYAPPDAVDSAFGWFKNIEKWSRRTTSFRAEFLRLRSAAESNAQRVIEREIKALVDDARDSYYQTLDLRKLEALCERGKEVSTGASEMTWEAWLNSVPAMMARAAILERDAQMGRVSWAAVEGQWDTVVKRLFSADPEFAYCEQRMKQARKQAVFHAAKAADRVAAEQMLSELCNDPVLSLDPEVWQRHGTHCLETIRALLEESVEMTTVTVGPLVQSARRALNRAQQFVDTGAQASAALIELRQWEAVAEAELGISRALRAVNGHLTRDMCIKVRNVFEGSGLASNSRQGRALATYWDWHKAAARAQLDRQSNESNVDTFSRLDTLLSILVLEPDDETVQTQMRQALLDTRQQFARNVADVCNDRDGTKFENRYRQTKSSADTRKGQLASMQLTEVAELRKQGSVIVNAHKLVEQQLGNRELFAGSGANVGDMLSREIDDLEQWQKDLSDLINALALARGRAVSGLRSPEQFQVARHVLRMPVRSRAPVQQVPEVFAGHPSLMSVKSVLEENEQRHAAQRQLANEVEVSLALATTTRADQLDNAHFETNRLNDDVSRSFDANSFIGYLRNRIGSEFNKAYPVEVALEKLRQMRREEADNACGLQSRLHFIDADDNNREYFSEREIEPVLARKVRQVMVIRDWLTTFKSSLRLTDIDFPGSVNFRHLMPGIKRRRDSGPTGLMEAHKQCHEIRVGDHESLVDGLWPLERMRNALSRESMQAYLALNLAKSDDSYAPVGNGRPIILCAAARELDGEREALYSDYDKQVSECAMLEQDIHRRIRQYDEAWQRFEAAYADMMHMRPKFIGARRVAQSEQWARFQACASEFCSICPKFEDFQAKLIEIQHKFSLVATCPDEMEHAR